MENKTHFFICLLLVLAVAAGGWLLYRHYNAVERSAGSNAIDTVQSIKDDNQSAGHDVDTATNQIGSAESELDGAITDVDNATNTVGQLQESVNSNQDTIAECNDLITAGHANTAKASSIFADIDSANKTDGTSR